MRAGYGSPLRRAVSACRTVHARSFRGASCRYQPHAGDPGRLSEHRPLKPSAPICVPANKGQWVTLTDFLWILGGARASGVEAGGHRAPQGQGRQDSAVATPLRLVMGTSTLQAGMESAGRITSLSSHPKCFPLEMVTPGGCPLFVAMMMRVRKAAGTCAGTQYCFLFHGWANIPVAQPIHQSIKIYSPLRRHNVLSCLRPRVLTHSFLDGRGEDIKALQERERRCAPPFPCMVQRHKSERVLRLAV